MGTRGWRGNAVSSSSSETEIQAEILTAIRRIGAWAWRVNSGARGGARMAPAGTPDICVVHPHGWLEVKKPGWKPSESPDETERAQRRWHAKARRCGVRVAIVTSKQEAIEKVLGWRA